jgi:DNA-binding PadR family transcriptional regulator
MSARGWCPGDFDPGVFDVLGCAGEMVDHLRRAAFRMAAGQGGPGGPVNDLRRAAFRMAAAQGGPGGPGGPGGHWKGGFGGPKGAGHWGGGGAWGAWWPGPGGPAGAPRGKKAGRGDVRAAILALLREGARTGYQIMSDIEDRSGGAWRPSPGAVYPALAQLADEGLIVGEESAGRRTFSLTEAGRQYVEQHPDMARGAWESPAQQEAWQVPGLFAEAARLGAGIVQITHVGTPEQLREAERLLERTRRRLYQILAEDDEDPDDDDPDDGDESQEDDDGDE